MARNKKTGELEVAMFFAERLSKVMNARFLATIENEEDNDTDTYITGPDGKKVPVQNTTSMGEVYKNCIRSSNINKKANVYQVDRIDWIKRVIFDKEFREYSDAHMIVLMVDGGMSISNECVEQLLNARPIESKFAGIYCVFLPTSNDKIGKVITLKSYWETPNIF